MCTVINDLTKRNNCNIYYNKCKLKHLHNKYLIGIIEPAIYTQETIDTILLASIKTRTPDTEQEQTFLLNISNPPLTIIQDNAFMYQVPNAHLIAITIPNSITRIGNDAFANNQLTTVTIPNSVTTIGNSAFGYNQLTTVTIPNSVTTIGNDAFNNNRLRTVTIPNSVTTIYYRAFAKNQLTTVTIPNSVTTIAYGAFNRNRLTTVTIPNRFKQDIRNYFETSNINFIYT